MNKSKKLKLLYIITFTSILTGNLLTFPFLAYSETAKLVHNISQRLDRGIVGPSGGTGGQPFMEPIPPDAVKVVGVYVWGGQYVDAVQFIWQNARGEIIEGRKWGGNKGNICIQLEFTYGQYIQSLSGRYGDKVDSIVIQRSDGYRVFCGGQGGQNNFSYIAPEGEAIWNFFGRSGDYIDAIGVIFDEFPRRLR